MKNQKTLSGLAYMFLGAALLVSGASLQEQVDRLAADPELQLAKTMYVSMFNRTVSAQTEFLATNSQAIPTQYEYAAAPAAEPVVAKRVSVAVSPRMEVIDVVVPEVPNVEVQIAELPRVLVPLAPVRSSRMKMQLLKVHARMATLKIPEFQVTHFAAQVPAMDFERVMVVSKASPKRATCEKSAVTKEASIDVDAAIAEAIAEMTTEL